jgi:hypothetical protein
MAKSRMSKEYAAFVDLTRKVLAVPKSEILRREAEYREQANKNPKKRGPKPKVTRTKPT